MLIIILIIIGTLLLIIGGNIPKLKLLATLGSLILGINTGKLIVNYIENSKIDYSIELIQSTSLEISDKHSNINTIELDSLEEFIIQDNK